METWALSFYIFEGGIIMAEEEIQVLPKTSCALRNNKVVACDDYFVNKNGKIVRDYNLLQDMRLEQACS